MNEEMTSEIQNILGDEGEDGGFANFYKFVKFIGEGVYSNVVEVLKKKNYKKIALKVAIFIMFSIRNRFWV